MSDNWGWHYGFGLKKECLLLIGLIVFWRGIKDGVFIERWRSRKRV